MDLDAKGGLDNMNETIWKGFKRIDFEFEGREAIITCHVKGIIDYINYKKF